MYVWQEMRVKSTTFGGAERTDAPLPPPSRVDEINSTSTSIAALASTIDLYSRLVFPLLFGVFNVIYWSVYLNLSAPTNEDDFVFFD